MGLTSRRKRYVSLLKVATATVHSRAPQLLAAFGHINVGGPTTGALDRRPQRVSIVWIARQRLGMEDELATWGAALVGTIEALTPNS